MFDILQMESDFLKPKIIMFIFDSVLSLGTYFFIDVMSGSPFIFFWSSSTEDCVVPILQNLQVIVPLQFDINLFV
jgi:ABC-type polysaccharide/polyol phosphate export permease